MTFTLAFRNLFHDRIRLVVTLVGILFSIVLVAVQLGLYLGARTMIISMIDRADGDLWVMAYGTKNFEEAQPITARENFAALSTPGVAKAIPLITSFTDWRKPTGGSTLVVVIGADAEDGGLRPWNVVEGDVSGLGARDAVIIDKTYLAELGVNGVGDTAQIGACARAHDGPHRGHPLLHGHAVRLHHPQPRANPASTCPPTRSPTCWSSSSRAPTSETVRQCDQRQGARQRGADPRRVPHSAASITGCLQPAPALP